MAKDPAFLFYPNDYIGGTMGMTFEEKGAYMELLMMQFNRGHMTEHMIRQTVGQLWDTIQDKFSQDENGLYYNIRLEEEKNKRKAFTDSRRNNKKGHNQYTKKRGHTTKHMKGHMENENEDENKDINIREKEFKEKVFSYSEYNNTMLKLFFNYWSQINDGGKKMHFEKQQTFDIKKRLITWASKDYNKSKKDIGDSDFN